MASAPKTWLSDFAVTYNAANDAFQFTFTDPAIGTLYVSRVGFSVRWLPQLLATAATYFSRPSFETVQYDGVTVDAARCTAPVAATPQLLHAAILALYVPVSTTPQELQSFRHGSTPELLKTGNPDPSYIEKWATSPMSDWDYEYNSAGAFSFPDNQSKVINEDGVYDFTVCVATRGNSSLRGVNIFLDTSNGSSMGSQPPNPALGSCHQSAFQPTWGGAPTLQCATLTGRAEFVAGTILRVAYVVEDDVETIADYTFWSMKLDPLVINGGAQGPPGAPGADGTNGANGANGVVQTVTAVYPLVASGTAADRVIEHSPIGGGPITITNPYQITFDQSGHRTASTTMAAPFNNIQSTSQITLTSGGALPTRTLTATHATNFVGAGTFTNVASLSTNSTGHVTGAVSGQPPEILANKNQPNGYAGLGPLGKIAASQLPALVVTDTYIVGPQADLVTLTAAEKGDIGIVTADPDNTLEGAWILQADPYSTLSNWVRLLPPGAGILYTVNGKIGPNAILGADDITTGTLPIAQLPALSVTGDVTGTGVAGTGSIPTTLTPTGVGAVTVTNADLTIGADGRIYAAASGTGGGGGTAYRSMKAVDSNGVADSSYFNGIEYPFLLFGVADVPAQSAGAVFGVYSNTATVTRMTFTEAGYYRATYKHILTITATVADIATVDTRISKNAAIVDVTTINKRQDAGATQAPVTRTVGSQYCDFFAIGDTLDFSVFTVTQPPLYSPFGPSAAIYKSVLIERLADP